MHRKLVQAFKLPPRLCELMLMLINAPVVPSEDVDAVLMHRLRKEMSEYGVSINSKRSVGYWISSEQKLHVQALLGEDPNPLVWTTSADGETDFLNPAWESFTGQSMHDSLGHGWLNLIHDDHRRGMGETWDMSVHHRIPFVYTTRLRCADGEYRWVTCKGNPVFDDRTNEIVRWDGTTIPLNLTYIEPT